MRNNIIIQLLIVLTLFSCGKNQPVEKEKSFKSYGEAFDPANAQDISKLVALMGEQDSIMVTLTATIDKTCAVKGCWMQLKTDTENTMRVTFKDYGFFVPKSGMEGKVTTITGFCKREETSVEDLKHFAKDAGESDEYIAAITSPKTELNFVASGVIIED